MTKTNDDIMREDAAKNLALLIETFHAFPPALQLATAYSLLKTLRKMYPREVQRHGERIAEKIAIDTSGFDHRRR